MISQAISTFLATGLADLILFIVVLIIFTRRQRQNYRSNLRLAMILLDKEILDWKDIDEIGVTDKKAGLLDILEGIL